MTVVLPLEQRAARNASIIRDWEAGEMTKKAIARKHGISHETVTQVLHAAYRRRLTDTPPWRGLTDEQKGWMEARRAPEPRPWGTRLK